MRKIKIVYMHNDHLANEVVYKISDFESGYLHKYIMIKLNGYGANHTIFGKLVSQTEYKDIEYNHMSNLSFPKDYYVDVYVLTDDEYKLMRI